MMSLVAVDVGGTNVRFAMVGADGLSAHHSMLCRDFPTLEAAFLAYQERIEQPVTAASIAVAGPVQGEHVIVTNNHWRFGKRELMQALRLDRLLVVNDFTAQALAQNDPTAHGNLPILDGTGQAAAPLLVIGPGTGLGVAALVPSPVGPVPLEGEGGHVGFAPQDDLELDLLRRMQAEAPHVSAEHFVSGGGLETLYRLLSGGTELPAPDIGAAALAGDATARQSVHVMLGILGTVMADAILTMGCWRGAVIAGGIVAQLHGLVADSPFAARLRHAGTMGHLLADLPVWLSVDPHAGLRGAAAAFDNASLASRVIAAG
jgi:glucokinase